MRYFFEIVYKGTHFHGWQVQSGATTVQGVLEDALSTVLRKKVGITGSGRTDTGVHCAQQFFHVDLPEAVEGQVLGHQLNTFLPKDIAIRTVRPVKADAHARFDALSRSYEYRITECKDPFSTEFAYYYHKDLDIPTMNAAAALLMEATDFQAFSKVKTQVNHFLCDVREAHWEKTLQGKVFHITANRFLRGMVRSIVGTLMEVGLGRCGLSGFQAIIDHKDRKEAGRAVPPQGLFLTEVTYPKEIFTDN